MSLSTIENLSRLQPQFDAVVPVSWRDRRHLLVTPSFIQWGDQRVMLDQVTQVAWSSRLHAINLTQSAYERLVRLVTPEGTLDIRFGRGVFGPAQDETQANAFQHLLACIDSQIEPRLLNQTLDTIAHGQPVEIANLVLSATGLHHQDRANTVTPWSSAPTAQVDQNQVVIQTNNNHNGVASIRRTTRTNNAVLLPGIMSAITLGN